MPNSTRVSYFVLSAYFDTGDLKYLFFTITLLFYIVIISVNLLLIVVICANTSLHEPMYMFLCSLFVNELFGSTALFPSLLLHILSDIHTLSAPFCLLQVFCMYAYGSVEFTNLAVMSYDRYVAICYPLQYNTHMTSAKVTLLIVVIWLPPFVAVFLCGNIINKVHCDNYSIIKLACSDTTVNNIYELIAASLTVYAPVSVILYTYMRILYVCFCGSKQTRQKAVSTCTPHLTSLLNFSFGICFQVLQNRFDMSSVPNTLQIFLSLYFLTWQSLFNPVMYGLKMSKIRLTCKSLILGSDDRSSNICL
ncbi:hypothetical protein Q5P01_009479 [Channa striata]|uniref:Olfactory receptor n=1 Tax=Channa striata TaxID=64152 RepID=A0AA88N280_CHASR|nr:hypothetical protein Q5P01_009479 [Channa striata]